VVCDLGGGRSKRAGEERRALTNKPHEISGSGELDTTTVVGAGTAATAIPLDIAAVPQPHFAPQRLPYQPGR
jgi:hypothetical protein